MCSRVSDSTNEAKFYADDDDVLQAKGFSREKKFSMVAQRQTLSETTRRQK